MLFSAVMLWVSTRDISLFLPYLPFEDFEGGASLHGEVTLGCSGLCGPVSGSEHPHDEVNAHKVNLRLLYVRLKLFHRRVGQSHVFEHSF